MPPHSCAQRWLSQWEARWPSLPPQPVKEGADDPAALAKQLANPIAALSSVPLESNYDWDMGPSGQGWRYRLNIQPVLPFTLNDDWNLISRTILPVVVQEGVFSPGGDDDQSGLGDTVQSFFFSPQAPTAGGWIWGAGPVFLLPTASEDLLGAEKWGIGPTGVALKQEGPWTVGVLANHIWSFAGNEDRQDVNSTFLQPFLGYTTPSATTFLVKAETTYDWDDERWTAPVNLLVAQLFKPTQGGLPFPVQVQFGYRFYLDTNDNGPDGGLRLNIVALFPR
jgi:hypothetical protein